MAHQGNITPTTQQTQDEPRSLYDILGIDPIYEQRMDAALARNHALRNKAWTIPLTEAEQQELDCLEQELDELEAILSAELRAKSPRSPLGHMVLPTEGRQPYTSEQLYEIIHEAFP